MGCCKCQNNPYDQSNLVYPLLVDRYAVNVLQPPVTLDRNSASSVTDFEGNVIETLPHEMGFDGARRVENRTPTLDLTGWSAAGTGGNDWDAIDGFGFLVHSGSGDQGKAIMIREAGGDGLSLTSAFPDPNQFALFEMTVNYDTGVATAYVNGVQTVTDTVSDEGLIKPQLFALGARILTGSYSLFTDCEFAEFRLYNREVSVNRQASIRQELMVKWGV